MIDHPLPTDERVSLIASLFSDSDETEAIKRLHGDDAQLFVDAVDEVFSHYSFQKNRTTDLNSNPPVVPSRHWIAWTHGSEGSV